MNHLMNHLMNLVNCFRPKGYKTICFARFGRFEVHKFTNPYIWGEVAFFSGLVAYLVCMN